MDTEGNSNVWGERLGEREMEGWERESDWKGESVWMRVISWACQSIPRVLTAADGGGVLQCSDLIQQLKWAIPGISWDLYTPQKERQKEEEDAAEELSALHHWHTAEGGKKNKPQTRTAVLLQFPDKAKCMYFQGRVQDFFCCFFFPFAVTANSTLPPSLPVDSAAKRAFPRI